MRALLVGLCALLGLGLSPARRALLQAPAAAATWSASRAPAAAADEDEAAAAALAAKLAARRQLLEASRSSTNRQREFDLSAQRAALYNTTSRAWACPPGVPCL